MWGWGRIGGTRSSRKLPVWRPRAVQLVAVTSLEMLPEGRVLHPPLVAIRAGSVERGPEFVLRARLEVVFVWGARHRIGQMQELMLPQVCQCRRGGQLVPGRDIVGEPSQVLNAALVGSDGSLIGRRSETMESKREHHQNDHQCSGCEQRVPTPRHVLRLLSTSRGSTRRYCRQPTRP